MLDRTKAEVQLYDVQYSCPTFKRSTKQMRGRDDYRSSASTISTSASQTSKVAKESVPLSLSCSFESCESRECYVTQRMGCFRSHTFSSIVSAYASS